MTYGYRGKFATTSNLHPDGPSEGLDQEPGQEPAAAGQAPEGELETGPALEEPTGQPEGPVEEPVEPVEGDQ